MKAPIIATLAAFSLVACQKENTFAPPPPIPVTVAHPIKREQVVYKQAPATLRGVAEIDIRARVRGVLEKKFFEEGMPVKKGDPLFLIEQPPYQAALAEAQATLEQAIAAQGIAKATLTRLQNAGNRAVSQNDIDVAQAEFDQAVAVVSQKHAKVKEAQLDLDYTEIMAPTSGLMSQTMVDVGNLVEGSPSTLLATITDDSQIRAQFEIPERGFIDFLDRRSENKDFSLENVKKVRLELAGGIIYEHEGAIDLLDSRVDSMTRTATARAVFPNPNHKLASGLFGIVGYPMIFGTENERPDTVLLPDGCVLRDLAGDFVWVVDKDNIVRRNTVESGQSVPKPSDDSSAPPSREILIISGLTTEDRVVVAGLQRAREGAKVDPQFADDPKASAPKPDQPEAPKD